MGLNFYWNKKVIRCIEARRQRNCHTEDNSPKYRKVGKIIRHPELGATHVATCVNVGDTCTDYLKSFSGSINADKRLRNKCAMTCYLLPRPFGERVRERGCFAS